VSPTGRGRGQQIARSSGEWSVFPVKHPCHYGPDRSHCAPAATAMVRSTRDVVIKAHDLATWGAQRCPSTSTVPSNAVSRRHPAVPDAAREGFRVEHGGCRGSATGRCPHWWISVWTTTRGLTRQSTWLCTTVDKRGDLSMTSVNISLYA
jgi:hypothetical protein